MQIVKPLTDGEVERIHEASEEILATVGLHVEHEELLRRLKAGGATVNETNGNVRIDPPLLRDLMKTIPASHTICQMDGTEDVVETGSKHFLTSIIMPRVIDLDTGKPRRPTMADLRRNNAVAQRLEPVKGIYRMEEPTVEEKVTSSCLDGLEEYICNNGKHIIMFGTNQQLLDRCMAIGQIISESQNIPLSKLITSSCPIMTPLYVPQFYGEYMLRSCEAGFAVFGCISPNAGATAPYSFAGSLVVGNTENLFVAAVSQIIRPGIPYFYMYSPSVTDMRTGNGRFYSMDRSIARSVLAQMGRFYNMPYISDCCGSMPPRFDMQTGAESFSAMLTSYSTDPAWLGAFGVGQNGLSFSAEMLLIHAAWLEAAKFLDRGIMVDEKHLGVENIRQAGPGGEFLTDDLTLELLREGEFFLNDLFDMTGTEDGKSIMERAREKVDEIVEGFESPLPGDLQEKLRRYLHDERRVG